MNKKISNNSLSGLLFVIALVIIILLFNLSTEVGMIFCQLLVIVVCIKRSVEISKTKGRTTEFCFFVIVSILLVIYLIFSFTNIVR